MAAPFSKHEAGLRHAKSNLKSPESSGEKSEQFLEAFPESQSLAQKEQTRPKFLTHEMGHESAKGYGLPPSRGYGRPRSDNHYGLNGNNNQVAKPIVNQLILANVPEGTNQAEMLAKLQDILAQAAGLGAGKPVQ